MTLAIFEPIAKYRVFAKLLAYLALRVSAGFGIYPGVSGRDERPVTS